MNYSIQHPKLNLDYSPESSTLQISVPHSPVTWCWTSQPFVVTSDQKKLFFSTAQCQSTTYNTGVAKGVRATYTNLTDEDGKVYPFTLETYISVENISGVLKAESHLTGDSLGDVTAVAFPPRLSFNAPEGHGYTVLPRMQGTLIPAGHPEKLHDGIVFERDAYIPVYGQVHDGCGYAAIFDTPYDARYSVVGEEIQPYFIPSLGLMAYPRAMVYTFFASGDFNTVAKVYRQYLLERGELVTLREKITRNPKIEYLIGCPIVHTSSGVHIHPASHFYDKEHPENNDTQITFAETAAHLTRLKADGVEKAYLHLDGWGHHGYDNLHPDPFPVHEGAGGAAGMKALQETCHALGFYFGIHDQYRDFYYDAPSFNLDHALVDIHGNHPFHDFWCGGPHSFLCGKLAVDYVRRNYQEFKNLGIQLDGSYLDVFSIVELDECFNPKHPMTRKECAEVRAHCLHMLTSQGIIPSSEETMGCMVNAMALCHHAPFYTTDWEDRVNAKNVGIPIPFFSLVYHECIVVPWFGIHEKGAWGIAGTDRGFYWALLTGGTIYYDVASTAEEIAFGKVALELHARIAHCELVRHELIDNHPRRRRSIFSDGTVVECDFDAEDFTITYPDGKVVSGH